MIGILQVQETANPSKLMGMQLITEENYRKFISDNQHVKIEDVDVEIGRPWRIKEFGPAKDYKPGELVLDQMCGSGTTLVESKLLGRDGIGVDVNPDAVMVAQDRLSFDYNTLDRPRRVETRTYVGDARNLDLIDEETVDLIATHPPYAGIISYSGKRILDDLSRLKLPAYIDAMRKVAAESYRVLKNNRYCGVLIVDTRKGRHYIPISLGVLQAFLSVGFILKEDIIKLQHKTMTTRQRWRGHSYDFYKIAHEHLYVFRKPALDEKTAPLKYSKKWW